MTEHTLRVRVTSELYNDLLLMSQTKGYKSLSPFIRDSLVNQVNGASHSELDKTVLAHSVQTLSLIRDTVKLLADDDSLSESLISKAKEASKNWSEEFVKKNS